MNFISRLSYFSGGFLIGLVFLMFFLSGKRTSCSYFPESRVKKDISRKNLEFKNLLKKNDSIALLKVLKGGVINFSKSKTDLKPCKQYYFELDNAKHKIWMVIENCKNKAIITSYSIAEN
tara:strand:+ start:295 stop:654 length:360 start_codon:yes stop_codon:yes gene_type:complete